MKRWIGIAGGVAAVGLLGWLLSQKPAEVESGGVVPVDGPVAAVAEAAFADKGGAAVSAPALDVAAASALPPVSDAVRLLVDPASDYAARLAAMRQLGYAIAPQDVAALMDFLNAPLPEGTKLKPNAYNSVRNDALELLLRQRQLPEGIGELLVGVYNDPRHDAMWRNYCIQFMEPYYERVAAGSVEQGAGNSGGDMAPSTGGSAADVPPRQLQAIQETLWEALGERENSNAGTALLALDKLARTHAGFDPAQVEAAMVELATDESASLANRATALRLCGERGG